MHNVENIEFMEVHGLVGTISYEWGEDSYSVISKFCRTEVAYTKTYKLLINET